MTSYNNLFHTGNGNQVNSHQGGFAGGRLGLGNRADVAANNTTVGPATIPTYRLQHGNTNTGVGNNTGGIGTPVQQPRRLTLLEQRTFGAINNGNTGFVGGNNNFVPASAQGNNNGNNAAADDIATYNGNNNGIANNNNVVAANNDNNNNVAAANNDNNNNNNVGAANNDNNVVAANDTDVASGDTNNRTVERNNTLTGASFKQHGELKFSLKKPNMKKSNPKLDPRLHGIKELVERQPTTELQSLLLAFAQANLLGMQYTAYKEQGLAKLNSDKDFIPISIRFSADLTYPKQLGKDPNTVAEVEGWKNDILDCQKKLTERTKRQSKRNTDYHDKAHQKTVIQEMIKLCANYAGREKIMSGNNNSTANRDVIAKGAVINFFISLPWYEKIRNNELTKRNVTGPPNLGDILFRSGQECNLAFVTTVCTEQTTEDQLIHLIHGDNREALRQTQYERQQQPRVTGMTPRILMTTPPANGAGTSVTPINIEDQNDVQLFLDREPVQDPLELWKSLETAVTRADNVITNRAGLSDEVVLARIGDRRLSDRVLYWMMEVFPPLLSVPFQAIQQDALKNRGDAYLKGALKSDSATDLAVEIEELLDKDDTVRCSQLKLSAMIQEGIAKALTQQARKKSLGGAGKPSSRENTTDGANGKNKSKSNTKVKFAKRPMKVQGTEYTGPNPYKKTKRTVQSPAKTNGKHDFHPGGKRHHQSQQRNNDARQHQPGRGGRGRGNSGRGRGRGRGRSGGRGRGNR